MALVCDVSNCRNHIGRADEAPHIPPSELVLHEGESVLLNICKYCKTKIIQGEFTITRNVPPSRD